MIPKSKFLMTINERRVFEKLKNKLDYQYVIFPQISVRTLIQRDYKISDNAQWKIIDYLICKKPYYEPVLAIELNDLSHEREDKKERDRKVTNLLKEIDIPIWFLKPEQDYERFDDMNLNKHIEIMINTYLESKLQNS